MHEKFYDKKLNASLHAPVLTAVVVNGVVVREFTWQPLGNFHDSGAAWGTVGLNESELKTQGFKLRREADEE